MPPSILAGSTLAPEMALLLACARTRLDADVDATIRTHLRQGLDWPGVLDLAERHGVGPLLYRRLARTCAEAVPPAALAELRARALRNARHALALTAELRALLADFAAHGIRAVPYKGPVLAAAAYGEPALRVFADLDLVVSAADVARARERLSARGYRPQLALSEAQTAALVAAGRALGFASPATRVIVELHTEAALDHPLGRLDPQRVGEELGTVTVAGVPMPSFAPETLLVILCLHGTKHTWSRLLWVCDIAELVRAGREAGGWDWDRLLDRARRWRVERTLLLGLRLARDLLDAPLPGAVASRLTAHRPVQALAAAIARRAFLPGFGPPGPLASTRLQLRALDGRRDRLRYCRGVLAPSEADWTAVALPDALRVLYYPLRLVRLAFGVPRGGHRP